MYVLVVCMYRMYYGTYSRTWLYMYRHSYRMMTVHNREAKTAVVGRSGWRV